MNRTARVLVLLAHAFVCATFAEPIPKEKIPGPLQPWVDWVLWGQEEARCPFFQDSGDRRQCVWPARLDLDLADSSGRFTQQWLVYKEAWVSLPGDARMWPQEVRVDGRPAVVTLQENAPSLRLAPGRHTVTGTFAWSAIPPVLQIPRETGLVSLRVRGAEVPFPAQDAQGRLWRQKQAEGVDEESRLDPSVHRSVQDDIPLVLVTQVEMRVSGKSREVLMGKALPEGFVPMSIRSALPARIDPDGRLRVQVRPGTWMVEITARHEGPVASITLAEAGGPWDPEEVWVFDARPHLRLVTVEGVPAIDPQQTTLPDAWKQKPAFLVKPGSTMTLAEKRRGDADPPPDWLHLQRTWWLDFDGGGLTTRDQITGVMERGWRLEMPSPAVMGRVTINGEDQFITRRREDGVAGVEVRQGRVDLSADSRIEGAVSKLPAVGWDQDFHEVSGVLQLPPAWRLFHASGVDSVSTTWIASWTLLDLFLGLILALSAARLWGGAWGAVALGTLALTWIEPGAPQWTWVALLAGEALRRVLPEGRLLRWAKAYQLIAAAALVLIAVPFMIRQARLALYPALELPGPHAVRVLAQEAKVAGLAGDEVEVPGRDEEDAERLRKLQETQPGEGRPATVRGARKVEFIGGAVAALAAHDPSAVVQTGPGLPEWGWTTVLLGWSGPVERGQRLRLWLIPPAANFVLGFLRILLLTALAVCALGFSGGDRLVGLLRRLRVARTLGLGSLVLALIGAAPSPARAQMPSNEILEALRQRLLQPPDCRPECASSPRLALEVGPDLLRARMEVHAAAVTAVPLPGGADQWLPQTVLLDGVPAPGLVRSADGKLWLQVSPGSHQVLMEGALADRDALQIPLPLKPHRVTAQAQGWAIEGLHEDGLPEDSLQLSRIRARDSKAARILDPGTLPPFVRVERTLRLGLKWQVDTRVVRLTPAGQGVVLEVPLLAGESVTSADVRAANGRALVSMGPQAAQVSWTSALAEAPVIELRAPERVPWVEIWRVIAGPVWHLEPQGIPVIHLPEQGEARRREWRPWPGESVSVAVSRPAGMSGQTLTIDSTSLTLAPGLRATDATLEISLRSSRGGQHRVTLPEGARLESVTIDMTAQPLRQEGREVTLPVVPGSQSASLSWRQGEGARLWFRVPEFGVGAASVNARTHIRVPEDRWVLLVGGPRLGPAVLFWSVLVVSVLISVGLGCLPITPLRWRHWLLLSLGLTQVPIWIAALIAAWFLALGWRRQRGAAAVSNLGFDSMQVLLVAWTAAALMGLFWSIEHGLLGYPEMQIAGNGSTSRELNWYLDRAGETLPRPWVLSVPVMVYRLAMLAWALWLASAMLRWLRWAWECFTDGGIWRPVRPPRKAAASQPGPA